jgi:hypothetical protein
VLLLVGARARRLALGPEFKRLGTVIVTVITLTILLAVRCK